MALLVLIQRPRLLQSSGRINFSKDFQGFCGWVKLVEGKEERISNIVRFCGFELETSMSLAFHWPELSCITMESNGECGLMVCPEGEESVLVISYVVSSISLLCQLPKKNTVVRKLKLEF